MKRLEPPAERVTVELDGHPLDVAADEPVALGLWCAGEKIISRSPKYHRPRGPYCFAAACAQCLLRVDGVPNVASCQVLAKAGMQLERQNAFPTAKVDIFSATDFLFPKGLNHHEMFAGVPIAEKVMAKVARQLAGLGKLPDSADEARAPAETVETEVVLVGLGVAGGAAAKVLAEAQVPFVALERDASVVSAFIGAPLDPSTPRLRSGQAPLRAGSARGERSAGEGSSFRCAVVLGLYQDDRGHFLAAATPQTLLKVRAKKFLLAHGGYPQLLAFEDNDLPGIFAGRAVEMLIRRYKVLPAQTIAVVGTPALAQPLAALIETAGGQALAVGAEPVKAHGHSHLTGLTVRRAGKTERVECEAAALCAPASPSFELARQAGAQVSWSAEEHLFFVEADADGRTKAAHVFVAGDQRGPMSADDAASSGERAAKAILRQVQR